jgi:tetratricopeptide (TPR) repeat protein
MRDEPGQAVAAKCPRCGAEDCLKGLSVRTWFTVFFLPVFPLGRGQRFTKCTKCQASFAMAPENFAGAAARADARQMQRAIAMYNSLRRSPANCIRLNELMQLYAGMGEFTQAASAAAEFPSAVNNSEQCMTTLGRVYLAQGEPAAALQWLDAAIARDPDLAEALYYKAVAHLKCTPPDSPQAIVAARAAKKLDYPGADELLADVEGAGAV